MIWSTFIFFFTVLVVAGDATNFHIVNNCPYTVWAVANPGGGQQLDHGQAWDVDINVPKGGTGRVWARTGCNFSSGGVGSCLTGDCDGKLTCTTAIGSPPSTLVEFATNQYAHTDFYDISLIHGFNVPIDFRPAFWKCDDIFCSADITGQCPPELRAPGGCNNPCTVFKTDEYCCKSGRCGPTNYSQFFKKRCQNAYSYPLDNTTNSFTCLTGTDYTVTFCP